MAPRNANRLLLWIEKRLQLILNRKGKPFQYMYCTVQLDQSLFLKTSLFFVYVSIPFCTCCVLKAEVVLLLHDRQQFHPLWHVNHTCCTRGAFTTLPQIPYFSSALAREPHSLYTWRVEQWEFTSPQTPRFSFALAREAHYQAYCAVEDYLPWRKENKKHQI